MGICLECFFSFVCLVFISFKFILVYQFQVNIEQSLHHAWSWQSHKYKFHYLGKVRTIMDSFVFIW